MKSANIFQLANGNISTLIPSTVDTIDLSQPFSNANRSIWGHISKNGTNQNSSPPTMNCGSMFADNSSLYLYGGGISVAYPAVGAPTTLPPHGVWQYELGSGQWSMAALSGVPVNRSILGMSAQSSSNPVAYYLSGVKEPASDPYFWTLPGATPYMDQGLLAFEEGSLAFQNYSTSGLNEYGTVGAGFMALIESIGSHGVLVAFGGISNVPGRPMNVTDEYDPSVQWNLSSVSVYDIGGQAWYQQNTTGDIPRWRYSGCSVVVSAPDQSSHSIYVFGGWGNTFGGSDGGVYVLSVPSFRWIRVNQESNERSRHQCSLVGNNTMLVVGGITPNYNYPQPTWDASGCDTTSMFAQGLGMFSLNNHSWFANYDPVAAAVPYQIHPNISAVIGGTTTGGATTMAPEGGFSQKALGVLLTGNENVETMKASGSSTSSSTTTPKNKNALSVGSIAGIIGSCVFGLLLGLVLCVVLFVRRRQNSAHDNAAEMSGQITRFELSDEKDKVFELGATVVLEKPLPRTPDEKGIKELEGHQWVQEVVGNANLPEHESATRSNWTTSIVAIESSHT